MGQRSQIICRVPPIYWNEDNPNNRGSEYLVFHNQWLYGVSFIEHLADILDNYELIKKDRKGRGWSSPLDYKEYLVDAIKSANYKDPRNIRKTHRYFEETQNDDAEIANWGNWSKFMESLDNNNGYIFLDINSNGEISYDILNGLEDAKPVARRTPESYVGLFYKQADFDKQPAFFEEYKRILERLKKYPRMDYKTIPFPVKKEVKKKEGNKTVRVSGHKRKL